MPYFLKSKWSALVKEKLTPGEAKLLLNLEKTKTCIHPEWLKKEDPETRRRIEHVVEKAYRKGLLHRIVLSCASGPFFLFPIKYEKRSSKRSNKGG